MKLSTIANFLDHIMKVTAFLLFIFGALTYLSPPFERWIFGITGPFENYYVGRFSVSFPENNKDDLITSDWGDSQISPNLSAWTAANGAKSLIEGAFALEGSTIYNASRDTSMNGRGSMSADAPIQRMAGVDQCLLVKTVTILPYQYVDGIAKRLVDDGKDLAIESESEIESSSGSWLPGPMEECFKTEVDCSDINSKKQADSRMAVWVRAVQVSC